MIIFLFSTTIALYLSEENGLLLDKDYSVTVKTVVVYSAHVKLK